LRTFGELIVLDFFVTLSCTLFVATLCWTLLYYCGVLDFRFTYP